MKGQVADLLRVDHIIEAIDRIYSFSINSIDQLKDEMILSATIRQLEIIGEASNRISEVTKKHFSEIPWIKIIGMRNTLVHEYWKVDVGEVWYVIQNELSHLEGSDARSFKLFGKKI